MKRVLIGILALTVFCFPSQLRAATANAVIQGTEENSSLAGSARFQDTDDGLQIEAQIFGAPPGLHGIHIHENGSCDDKGNAAGGHFNPRGAKHGFLITDGLDGAHAGDLGNIEIDENGEGTLYLVAPGLTVSEGEQAVAGRAIIFHEKKDDFRQPTGNAGGRIGCGVIKKT